jgi:hypothetical protein
MMLRIWNVQMMPIHVKLNLTPLLGGGEDFLACAIDLDDEGSSVAFCKVGEFCDDDTVVEFDLGQEEGQVERD